jgi:hypothetical protein
MNAGQFISGGNHSQLLQKELCRQKENTVPSGTIELGEDNFAQLR